MTFTREHIRRAIDKNERALEISRQITTLATSIKERLPHFLFVESFSSEYGCPSKEDWCLDIVLYDTRNHQLVLVTTQFALVNGVHTSWLSEKPNYLPFPKPCHLKVQKLGIEAWETFEIDIVDKLVYSRLKIINGKEIEVEKHEATGHSLIPEFTLGG